MTALTDVLDAMEARANAATPAEWVWGHDEPGDEFSYKVFDFASAGYIAEHMARNDAEFTAYARDDVPALLAGVRAVLALHEPDVWIDEGPNGELMPRGLGCETCREAYPCSTVRALSDALGVSDV